MAALRDFFEIVGLFVVCLFLFLWGLSTQEVISFDSRFYLFAIEMWRNGPSWFPTTYDLPYPDYPGTATLLIYITALFWGGLNKAIAVFPSAVAAALTVVVTYCLGALHKKQWGLAAACILMSTVVYIKSARAISLDMYTTLITATCFYLVYSADLKDKQERVWWVYLLLIASFSFRGPIGLIIPTGVVCTYYLINRNIKELFFVGAFSLLILILSSFFLLTVANHVGGDDLVHRVMVMQALSRMDTSQLSPYFYFDEAWSAYALSFPLAVLVSVGTLYYTWRIHTTSADIKLLFRLLGWVLVILIGMSVPGDKKIRYVLPIVPALALMAAYPFVASTKEKYFVLLHRVFLHLFLFMPGLLWIGVSFFHHYATKHLPGFISYYPWITTFLLIVQSTVWTLNQRMTKRVALREASILIAAALSFVLVYITVVEQVILYVDRTHDFVVQVETQRLNQRANLVFYREDPDGLPIKYIINMWTNTKPVFVEQYYDLANYNQPAYFVTSKEYYDQLPLSMLAQFHTVFVGSMGHTPVVVFTNVPPGITQ